MLRRFLPLLFSAALLAAAPKGTLVIVGGHGMSPDIQEAFLKAAGGKGGVVGIIPTSTVDPEGEIKDWQEILPPAGMTLVPLDVRKREDSSDPKLLEAAAKCTGFWFSGGDQARVNAKIVGTPLQKVILDRYASGAGVGGTSAGAAIMSKIMLTGDDMNGEESIRLMGAGCYKTLEGMGFLPEHCIVDQHFLKRNRQNRLISIAMTHPDHLAFGVDETTALVVKDGKGTVYGESGVMVFDPAGMKLEHGGFSGLAIHYLRKGGTLDLTTRKVQP